MVSRWGAVRQPGPVPGLQEPVAAIEGVGHLGRGPIVPAVTERDWTPARQQGDCAGIQGSVPAPAGELRRCWASARGSGAAPGSESLESARRWKVRFPRPPPAPGREPPERGPGGEQPVQGGGIPAPPITPTLKPPPACPPAPPAPGRTPRAGSTSKQRLDIVVSCTVKAVMTGAG